MTRYAGRWLTTFGPMELQENGSHVYGKYGLNDLPSTIEGEWQDGRLVFHYQEAAESGEGWFEQTRYGQFRGQYRTSPSSSWHDWNGQREWDGIWETSFGRMRLMQEEGRVLGFYNGPGPSRIEGQFNGQRLFFHYVEPNARGEGWFELAPDAQSFQGSWHPDGVTGWSPWEGQRVRPRPGLTWLMVFEAYWQSSLTHEEYSYGVMLKEFFARVPGVAVRQRFFNDESSLQRWLHELIYIPEPAIVLISSHGSPEGVTVHGQTINTRLVVDSLRQASNILLLHFAACSMLKEDQDGDFAHRIGPDAPFPISGYSVGVDWGGSAVSEFSYLDMILSKNLSPEEAARRLPKLVAYVGDDAPEESPYPPVHFRFFKPGSRPPAGTTPKPTLWAKLTGGILPG